MIAWPWRDLAELHDIGVVPHPHAREILDDLNGWGHVVLEYEDVDDQATAWDALQAMKAAVTLIESLLAPRLHDSIPAKPGWVETPVGIVKRAERGKTTTWEHRKVIRAVVTTAIAERRPNADGEIPSPEEAALEAIEACAGIDYWRVRALQKMQIDANEYREIVNGRPWVTRA